jgi:hypothetical protein
VVTAVCRLPSDNIVIFAEQMKRLRVIVAAREPRPIDHLQRAWLLDKLG